MYYLIESKNQIDYLIEKAKGKCFVNIISLNDNYHPYLTSICLIYYKPLDDKGYMLCYNHPDSLNKIEFLDIKTLLSKHENILVLDKKFHLYFLPSELPLLDLNFIKLDKDNDIFDLSDISTPVHDYFYNKNETLHDLNKIIPIQKHFQKQEATFAKISEYLLKGVWEEEVEGGMLERVRWYNEDYTEVFYKIEKNGIAIERNKFFKNFETSYDLYSIKDDRIYTSYNLYNLTSRPSNTFNNINFAALQKNTRSSFIPSNDVLIEFDFDGYHPRLIGHHININFKNQPVHKTMAEWYFNNSNPSEDEIKQAKNLTFKQIYGGIDEKYLDISFFFHVNEWVNDMFDEYNFNKSHSLPTGRNIKFSNNINKNKLFNYHIQATETFENVNKIKDIFKLIENKKTKLIHYTYDSFLLDISMDDGVDLVKQLENILTTKFPVKKAYGKNYKEMVRF